MKWNVLKNIAVQDSSQDLPDPLPEGCDADCEAAARAYLPVGTQNVDINAGGQTVAQGDVLKSEYKMVVIVGNDNSNPSFVSLNYKQIKEVLTPLLLITKFNFLLTSMIYI